MTSINPNGGFTWAYRMNGGAWSYTNEPTPDFTAPGEFMFDFGAFGAPGDVHDIRVWTLRGGRRGPNYKLYTWVVVP
jgi:hypothetical protein